MRYFKLLYDYKNDRDVICCICKELFGIDRYDVEKGMGITNWDERITFLFNPFSGSRFTDYLANNLAWFIVSPFFKNMLEKNHIKGIQYLPIIMVNEIDGTVLENYYMANIYNLVDALDLEHSKYSWYSINEDEKVLSVDVYSLKEREIKNLDIFRLKGSTMSIFISEKVKNIVEISKISGCDFLEVKVY